MFNQVILKFSIFYITLIILHMIMPLIWRVNYPVDMESASSTFSHIISSANTHYFVWYSLSMLAYGALLFYMIFYVVRVHKLHLLLIITSFTAVYFHALIHPGMLFFRFLDYLPSIESRVIEFCAIWILIISGIFGGPVLGALILKKVAKP